MKTHVLFKPRPCTDQMSADKGLACFVEKEPEADYGSANPNWGVVSLVPIACFEKEKDSCSR